MHTRRRTLIAAAILLISSIIAVPAYGSAAPIAVGCDRDELARAQALVDAFARAEAQVGPDAIDLAPGCIYTLTRTDNDVAGGMGPTGLPVVAGELTLRGHGATIRRSPDPATPHFRLLHVNGGRLGVNNVTLSGGHSDLIGGALHSDFGTISFTDARVVGNHDSRDGVGGLSVRGGRLDLLRVTIQGNTGRGFNEGGVAIASRGSTVAMTDTLIADNVLSMAPERRLIGGVIYNNHGVLTITRSTLRGNRVDGRAPPGSSWGTQIYGGVIGNYDAGIAMPLSATIRESQIVDNLIQTDNWMAAGVLGGRNIVVDASTIARNTVEGSNIKGVVLIADGAITNSTISGNEARGAGLYPATESGGVVGMNLSIASSTIAGNRAVGPATAFTPRASGLSGTGAITNTIVAGNSLEDSADLAGMWASGGGNLVGALGAASGLADGVGGDRAGTAQAPLDPLLAPLADNGGPTETHALLPGSLALDSGVGAVCPPVDQRGVARPQGDACDRGAFEHAVLPDPTETPAPSPSATPEQTPAPSPSATPSPAGGGQLRPRVYLPVVS